MSKVSIRFTVLHDTDEVEVELSRDLSSPDGAMMRHYLRARDVPFEKFAPDHLFIMELASPALAVGTPDAGFGPSVQWVRYSWAEGENITQADVMDFIYRAVENANRLWAGISEARDKHESLAEFSRLRQMRAALVAITSHEQHEYTAAWMQEGARAILKKLDSLLVEFTHLE